MNTTTPLLRTVSLGWSCGSCGELITSIEDGFVEWLAGADEYAADKYGTTRIKGLRLVHSLCRYDDRREFQRDQSLVEGLPLGRRFRALKLWFVMRYFGREKLAEMIRSQIAWARDLAAAVDADPHFERAAPAPFSVVCFRYKGTDDENRRLLESVNASGEFFLSHTVLHGKYTLHLAIGILAFAVMCAGIVALTKTAPATMSADVHRV